MSIRENLKKINPPRNKAWRKILLPVFIILLAFLSFGLGRLSVESERHVPVVIKKAPERIFTNIRHTHDIKTRTQDAKKKNFVASKNGTRYYLPWCDGVDRIHDANKIWFETEVEAKNYGLTPAKNCGGI